MKDTLPTLLERTAAILSDSAHLLFQIEDIITPLLARTPHSGDDPVSAARYRTNMVSLQNIDLLSQTLEDLSFWLEDLAQEARHTSGGPISPEAAMKRVRLAELRLRLLGQRRPSEREMPSEPVLF